MFKDLLHTLRQLRRNPGFGFAAVLSLALGIAATTAVFSVIYGLLMHPYPYRSADRMIGILAEDKGGNRNHVLVTGSQFEQIQQVASIESAAAWQSWDLPMTGAELPEDVRSTFLTANASSYFGVPPFLGRGLLPSDVPEHRPAQAVAVLSYAFWQRHYHASRDVLGKVLELEHKSYAIVGVLPPRFTWTGADVYLPLEIPYGAHSVVGFSAILKPGVSVEAARRQFQALFEQFAKENPARFTNGFRVRIERLTDRYDKSLRHTLYVLFGAVLLLLAIGCANVSILLLARGASRRAELSLRAALGASRFRIVRQLLTESLVIALSGAFMGVLLALYAVPLIVKWLPRYSYPAEAAIAVNVPVLVFCALLAFITSLVFGLSPALQLSRSGINLRGSRRRRTHSTLIAGQIALTLLLLTVAGGAAQTFFRLIHTNLGYDPQHTMSVGIPVHPGSHHTWQARAAYFDRLRASVAALPEVVSVANSFDATPPFNGVNQRFEILNRITGPGDESRVNLVGPQYFSVLHIPVRQGRIWNRVETLRGAHLAAINETMARRYWPAGDAIGHAIRMPDLKEELPMRLAAPASDQWFQIAAIVADVRNDGLLTPVKPAIYLPYTIWMGLEMDLLVRTHGAPLSVLHAVRARVQAVDPDQEVDQYVPSLEELIGMQTEWQRGRLMAMLFGVFALLALALATAGLYSVVSFSVVRRTNEFGIRMALGAQRSHVLRTVLLSASSAVGSGVLVGFLLSAGLNSLLVRWTDIGSRHPLLLVAAALLLVLASLLAALLPARRASAIDPMEALRYQ
ncbi:MAG TPA: ADOP family duplicated permease [Bryobacteraceae bacterium]